MNSWSRMRKRIILGIVVLAMGVLVGIPVYFLFHTAPTCSDGVRNGDETGVDCGGSCQKLCRVESLPIITKGDPRVLLVAPNTYVVAALLENSNGDAHIFHARYKVLLYSSESLAPVKTIESETYVPRGTAFALFAGPYTAEVGAVPVRATLEWDQTSLVWVKDSSVVPELTVGETVYSRLDSAPRLSVLIGNPTLQSVKGVDLTALLYDGSGTIVAASKTFVDSLLPNEEKQAIFTWPKPFAIAPVQTQIFPVILPAALQ